MSSRFILRVTAPVVAISLLLLAVGIGTAWQVKHWQETVSKDLRENVSGMRAGEEMEILVLEVRIQLNLFLTKGDRSHLKKVLSLRPVTQHWLGEAERWSNTPSEERLVNRIRKGHELFWSELERLKEHSPADQKGTRLRDLIDDVLVREVQEPAHEYLDLNEDQAEKAIQKHEAFADQLVWGLLILGTCGAAAGLVAGFGVARGLSRSLIQLSVLIRDTAGRLDVGVEPVTFLEGNLGDLENLLRLIGTRVGAIVERLQEREREFLIAGQLAAVGQLAAGMAHELRNPLTSMKLLVQGAMTDDGGGDGWTCQGLNGRELNILEEEITRLEQLTKSFLDFARPPRPETRILDLRPMIEQTLALVAGRAAAASVQVEPVMPASALFAAVDPGQFRQVLLNLLLNALDFTPAGGTIRVLLTSEQDGGLTLQVTDSGCGLPAELGERIFDPFTTTKDTGLGLGLSICKRIAEAHGGTLVCANRPEGGAVFSFRLPASNPEFGIRNEK